MHAVSSGIVHSTIRNLLLLHQFMVAKIHFFLAFASIRLIWFWIKVKRGDLNSQGIVYRNFHFTSYSHDLLSSGQCWIFACFDSQFSPRPHHFILLFLSFSLSLASFATCFIFSVSFFFVLFVSIWAHC